MTLKLALVVLVLAWMALRYLTSKEWLGEDS